MKQVGQAYVGTDGQWYYYTEADVLLEKIIKADQDDWNYPSPARALKVHELEKQYKELTGKKAPQWPSRGRW